MVHRWFGGLKPGREFALLIVAGALFAGGCNPPGKGEIKLQGTKEEQTNRITDPFGDNSKKADFQVPGPKGKDFRSIKNRGAGN